MVRAQEQHIRPSSVPNPVLSSRPFAVRTCAHQAIIAQRPGPSSVDDFEDLSTCQKLQLRDLRLNGQLSQRPYQTLPSEHKSSPKAVQGESLKYQHCSTKFKPSKAACLHDLTNCRLCIPLLSTLDTHPD